MDPQLCKQIRSLKRNVIVLGLIVAVLVLDRMCGAPVAARQTGEAPKKSTFDEIVARRITIVDPKGVRRILLSHDSPASVYKGREFHRHAAPDAASILFFKGDGDEVGGIAFGKNHEGQDEVISFDYSRLPLDGIKMGLVETGRGGGCFVMLRDAPPADVRCDPAKLHAELQSGKLGEEAQKLRRYGSTRILLGTEDRNAAVVLRDKHGKKRIVISVDKDDTARFEILDGNGKVVARLPEK